MDKTGKFIARIVGGVSLAFGIAAAILAVWAIDRQFAIRGIVQVSAAAVIVIFLSISAFCCLVGYRLVFNRPNSNGSLLSPTGWRMLTLCVWVIGLTIAAIGLARRDYSLLLGALGLGALGFGSDFVGRAASRKEALSVFPPETSLLQLDGFVPSGFSIEQCREN